METETPRLEAVRRHLRGVRRRILWAFVAFGLGTSSTWYFRQAVIGLLLAPAHGMLSETGRPIVTSPTEMLGLTIHLAMLGGLVVAVPVAAYQIAGFLRPALSQQQRRFFALFLPAGIVCYGAGVAFAYFVLLPTGLGFLLHFGTDIADSMIRVSEYMDLALAMLFWLGVVFELPLAMFLLVKLRIVSFRRFRGLRAYVPAMAFILSAIITPTFDVVNQILVAVPMILLFETGMLLSWLARPRPLAGERMP